MNYTDPKSFEKAKKAYDNIQVLLNGTVDAFLAENPDSDFDRGIFLRQYDYALQCMLLAVVLGDGVAHPEEVDAIHAIAQNGDLMQMISNERVTWSWEEHAEASPYLVTKMQLTLEERLQDIVDDFSALIIVSASQTNADAYIDLLLENTRRIAEGIAGVDGALDPNESDIISVKIKEIFLESLRRAEMKLRH